MANNQGKPNTNPFRRTVRRCRSEFNSHEHKPQHAISCTHQKPSKHTPRKMISKNKTRQTRIRTVWKHAANVLGRVGRNRPLPPNNMRIAPLLAHLYTLVIFPMLATHIYPQVSRDPHHPHGEPLNRAPNIPRWPQTAGNAPEHKSFPDTQKKTKLARRYAHQTPHGIDFGSSTRELAAGNLWWHFLPVSLSLSLSHSLYVSLSVCLSPVSSFPAQSLAHVSPRTLHTTAHLPQDTPVIDHLPLSPNFAATAM